MVWHLPNVSFKFCEEWENREKWVNFDGNNGDGDENDDDDDEIMRSETILLKLINNSLRKYKGN